MSSARTKVGHGLAKVLGIKLEYRNELGHEGVTRGESVFSIDSADSYVEHEPTIFDWFREVVPTRAGVRQYFTDLLPFLQWIPFYNWTWATGDLIAGITVGAVVVPQGMSYATLAELPVQFGLYSSFMGVMIYWLFATSKDITIGPVAVLSTVTGNVVLAVQQAHPQTWNANNAHILASALSLIAGSIVCFIGIVRLGWIVNFISLAAICAYMTGSALNIAVGQVPSLMGITGFSSRQSTYKVVIDILKHLGRSDLNAAMGLTALFLLYAIRFTFNQLAKRDPKRRKLWFIINTLRTAFVILLYTLISWLVNRHIKDHNSKYAKFKILGTVPRGFKNAAVPTVTKSIIRDFSSYLPATVIVMLIEHISISRSFGRVNNYTINPSQELIAIGVTNIFGPFLGAYPATGSFSRTAIKSKAGVRTPFAGLITGIVVLLAIYALPAVFFYIPSASLSAVIIHAVGDLITPPNTLYQFWRVSPLEVLIFFAGVIVTVFSSIEDGIYTTICVSFALYIFRLFNAQGRFLGRVSVHSVVGDHVMEEQKHGNDKGATSGSERSIFLPIDHKDGSNPGITVKQPYPGVFIYRFSEGYVYTNADHYTDYLVSEIFRLTRRTDPNFFPRLGDRPWNDPGVSRKSSGIADGDKGKPTLKAIILDFSSVNNVDVTSIQNLIDVRNQLDRYAAPEHVDWHFAHINNRWTKRALAAAGFGYPTPTGDGDHVHRWKPIFSVAEIGGDNSAAHTAEYDYNTRQHSRRSAGVESGESGDAITPIGGSKPFDPIGDYTARSGGQTFTVGGINRPLFHIDLASALHNAIANVEHRNTGLQSDSESDLQKST